jgi:tetratricopeptide (TPR) repeat protein
MKYYLIIGLIVLVAAGVVYVLLPAKPAGQVGNDVSKANDLYQEGLKWKADKGLLNREESYTNAINSWRELIDKYPKSDKCADAAFLTADLYEKYSTKDYALAAEYYEKALTFDPNLKNDVRWRLAVIQDEKLKNLDKAHQAYETVLNSNIGYEEEPKQKEKASKRIAEIKALGH